MNLNMYTPDGLNFVYAEGTEEAKIIFNEENDTEYENSDFVKYLDDDVGACYEMIGLGGYNTVEIRHFISFLGLDSPCYVGNLESVLEDMRWF